MSAALKSVVREVYRQAKELGVQPPNATRLVKLIYLADIEWRKSHQGEPLSDLHWRFHYYGPYADEFSAILGGDDAEVVELVDGRTVRTLSFDDLESPQTSENISAIIRRVVKAWGDAHINNLLSHVYFETEPMENARRGEALDFSKLRTLAPIALKLDSAKLRQLREELDQRVQALALTREGVHFSSIDLESEHAWDDEDVPVRLPPGTIVTT